MPIGTHGALWRLQLSRCSSTFNHHLFWIFSEILSTRSNSYNKLSNVHHDKLQCLIYSNEKLNAFHIQGFLFGRYRHRTIGKVDPIFFYNRILAIMGNRHDNCFLALPVFSLHFFSIGLYGFVAAIVPATYLLHRSLR